MKRFFVLDSFRGLCAVMVMLFHIKDYNVLTDNAFVNNSHLFVTFFFVLSGFVISFIYLDKVFTKTTALHFLENRFRRVYPLYLYALLAYAVVELTRGYLFRMGYLETPQLPGNNLRSFVASLFLVNATPLVGAGNELSWNYPGWSISSEAIAYVLYALLLFSFRRHRYLKYISVAIVPLVVFMVEQRVHWVFFEGLIGFFSGVIVYMIYQRYTLRLLNHYVIASITECLLVIITIAMICAWKESVNQAYYTFIFALDIYIFAHSKGCVSSLLLKKPFQGLGKYSYSIYLNHIIVIEVLHFVLVRFLKMDGWLLYLVPVVMVLATIVYSVFTYKFIEIRFYRKRIAKPGAAPGLTK